MEKYSDYNTSLPMSGAELEREVRKIMRERKRQEDEFNRKHGARIMGFKSIKEIPMDSDTLNEEVQKITVAVNNTYQN